MRVLLDTNIIIHRETNNPIHPSIGVLFNWLDKLGYEKCVHPSTIDEIRRYQNNNVVAAFERKTQSYNVLKTIAPESNEISKVRKKYDVDDNDATDTDLLKEVFAGRIEFLITEDRKIHRKATVLGVDERVFAIESFLEKVTVENPELKDYQVLSVKKEYFGNVDVKDSFFDSFRDDYVDFENWFAKKSDEIAYVCKGDDGAILAFLYVKTEEKNENYSDIVPMFVPKKRLKIGTFKVVLNGFKLGERFIKIIFDNALLYGVDEIYVTIFDKTVEQKRLIELMLEWGFVYHGIKSSESGVEDVYVRTLSPAFNIVNPKITYPYFSTKRKTFLVPIWPSYHTDLLPDSFLRTESPNDFIENEPYRNAIRKIYISRSIRRDIDKGDVIIFYRTRSGTSPAYYTAVITTIGICDGKYDKINSEDEFVLKCRKRSVFSDEELSEWWNYNPNYRPFIISFLYVYSFERKYRINRARLLNLGVLDGSENEIRGLKLISKEDFKIILTETKTNESLIVD